MTTVLVTGATGYIGGQLVPALLDRGVTVRVLSRNPSSVRRQPWGSQVDVAEGDASDAAAVRRALDGVDVAYYLLHSMDGGSDFAGRDLAMARGFAKAAAAQGVERIVYLGGLHPDGELSPHLASRVEVGEVFLEGPVPAVVFQAGIVLGDGSASFDMLRHLTERLPVMVAPRWVDNLIQPIAVADVVHYLAGALDLPSGTNRSYDIAGSDVLTYGDMMRRYAEVVGLGPRRIVSVPVLTPRLAGLWVDVVTPVPAGVARPLVGSLVHDAVADEDDALRDIGEPPGGRTGFDRAVRAAVRDVDPHRWRRTLARTSAVVAAAAVAGSLLADPESRWYQRLSKPAWQPPKAAFPVVWTGLYAATALTTARASAELAEAGKADDARDLEVALGANMALNAAWPGLFFRSRRPWLAAAECAALTASSADLARRTGAAGRGKGAIVGAYAAWSGFATVLSAAIARRNRAR
ncbi:tryptophan-rich sensory protein [Knoellia koreensis]|uniref:NAD(P)H-binding protein n=1 Tax=Knoellia koreensis TaxID=2730921 RepID=A0A849HK25_9MICO|nr:tryptophan-rich sensory protein [Knoellia sp. DB2414S]NNM47499.1 NAD(P)H-binding protein [Knoellia sp. DB2414S]